MVVKNTYLTFKNKIHTNRLLRSVAAFFVLLISLAILAPLLANDKPLVCHYKGQWLFPAFSLKTEVILSNHEVINYQMGREWKLFPLDVAVFPPCAYSPHTIDPDNAPYKSPFDHQSITLNNKITFSIPLKFRHWLGTTQNGNDVLSHLIHGARVSIGVGILSTLIASVVGMLLGAFSGYFGNHALKIGYIQLFLLLVSAFLAWFYAISTREEELSLAFNNGGMKLMLELCLSVFIFLSILLSFGALGKWVEQLLKIEKKIPLPLDALISRIIQILDAIPSLLIVMSISIVAKPSFTLLVLIIGLLNWTQIVRVVRAEYMKAKRLDYILSCKSMGMSDSRILFKHILMNTIPIIIVQLIYTMSGAVLLEASLSFIGIGMPANMVSWGGLLNEAHQHFSSWWLVLFPGLCLFILLYTYNKVASEMTKINKRL